MSNENGQDSLVLDAAQTNEETTTEVAETEQYSADSEIALQPKTGSAPITKSDIILPTLRLAHNVGALGEEFQKGSYVIDGSTQVTQFNQKENSSTPIHLTVIDFQKSYVENVPWGDDRVPEILMSEEAVTKRNKTFNYWTDDNNKKQEPHFWPTLKLKVLVKRPTIQILNQEGELEDVSKTTFPYNFDGDDYAMVAWELQRSGYTRAGRRILSAYHNKVFDCTVCGSFKLSSSLSSFGTNKTFVPEIQYGEKHSDDFVSWASKL